MGGIGSGRRKLPSLDLSAKHGRFIKEYERTRDVEKSALRAGISRQWGYRLLRRLQMDLDFGKESVI